MKVRLGNNNYVRRGTVYAANSVIEFPDDEIPSVTWTKVPDNTPVDRVVEFHPNGTAADRKKRRTGEEEDDNPATRPLPDTPPTAKSVAGFIPNTSKGADEKPALDPEEARKRREEKQRARASLNAPVAVSPKEADSAIKAVEERQQKAAKAREEELKAQTEAQGHAAEQPKTTRTHHGADDKKHG